VNKQNYDEYKKEIHLHQICSMHPIFSSESLDRHLLLTTKNGLRIYINFTIEQEFAGMQAKSQMVEDLKL